VVDAKHWKMTKRKKSTKIREERLARLKASCEALPSHLQSALPKPPLGLDSQPSLCMESCCATAHQQIFHFTDIILWRLLSKISWQKRSDIEHRSGAITCAEWKMNAARPAKRRRLDVEDNHHNQAEQPVYPSTQSYLHPAAYHKPPIKLEAYNVGNKATPANRAQLLPSTSRPTSRNSMNSIEQGQLECCYGMVGLKSAVSCYDSV
jgi:hypothetical protein